MRKCTAFDFILLYQRTFYLLFPINYFLKNNKTYRVSFILGDCVFIKMKCTKQSAIGCIFQCHSPEMKCTKPSYRCLHLRRNTLEKNTIYSCTRTLIGQKNFPNLRSTDKTFFTKLSRPQDDLLSLTLSLCVSRSLSLVWCPQLRRIEHICRLKLMI